MSILSDWMGHKISFSTAADEAGQWVAKLVDGNQLATAAGGALLSDLKRAASDAITVGDSVLGPIILNSAKVVEVELEAMLAKATGGVSVIANPLINAGIDTMALSLKNVIDVWATQAKAQLVPTPPSSGS